MVVAACCCELEVVIDVKNHELSSFRDGAKARVLRHAGASRLALCVDPDVSDVIRSAAGAEQLMGGVELPS